jgi:NADH dehydrogenase/NADH:ubiquinone oxidoreductase subunit G
MLNVKVNGKEINVEKGETILNACERIGVFIPTLCYNESIESYSVCRLCVVETKYNGRKRIVTACNYQIENDGIIIETNSDKVIKIRKMIIELLLALCPNVDVIKKLAREYGVEKIRFKKEDEDCILCGLCVRACSDIVGRSAIGFAYRGVKREVVTPFLTQSDTCIGCGTCAYVCPTGKIKIKDEDNIREIMPFNTKLKLVKCKICKEYFSTKPQIELMKSLGVKKELLDICLNCRK